MRTTLAGSRGARARVALFASVVVLLVARGAVFGAPSVAVPSANQQTAALVARGDSIFRGRLGGALCWTCHGTNAKGMPNMGPDLTDTVWLHVDGSVAQIESLIRTGVARPKRGTVPMPPWGGPPLDSARLHAVATYVASLSQRRAP